MTDTHASTTTESSKRAHGQGGVELTAVTKRFGELNAVDDLTLSVESGEFFSMLGPSGSGKTTVLRLIAGFDEVTHGTIAIAGADVTRAAPFDRNVNTVFQDYALFPHMSIAENVGYGLRVRKVPKSEQADRVANALAQVRLSHLADRLPHQLSGGQRQRICIARALALQPDLIIADESVSALDVSVQARVLDLLRDLQRELGVSYLFISHDMAVVNNVSDRVGVMYLGQIVELGTTAQIFGNPQHPYTRLLIEAVPIPDPARARAAIPCRASDLPSALHPPGQAPQRVSLVDIGNGHLVAT